MRVIRDLKELYTRREVLLNIVMRDLEVKYKGSLLGIFWSLLNPLMMLLIYTVVFRYVIGMDVRNFPIFFMCGFLPWVFLANSVTMAAPCIVNNPNLVRKVYMPRAIIPLSAMLACLVEFAMTLVILLLALPFFAQAPGLLALLLPPVVLIQAVFVAGLALIFSASTVHFRDIKHLLDVLLIVWFWLTPIVYPLSKVKSLDLPWPALNSLVIGLINRNPMSVFVSVYRAILLNNTLPPMATVGLMFIYAVGSAAIGWLLFTRSSARFAEAI
ncbi:MAG: ABC transporter permease [Candidatus Coatesbacteria bacterium]|nr:ABC transporter permease [Candidatus Coatesbacteria bacterium]